MADKVKPVFTFLDNEITLYSIMGNIGVENILSGWN